MPQDPSYPYLRTHADDGRPGTAGFHFSIIECVEKLNYVTPFCLLFAGPARVASAGGEDDEIYAGYDASLPPGKTSYEADGYNEDKGNADDDSDDVYEVVDETSAPPQLPPKPPPKPGQSNLYVYIRFIFFL